MSQLPQPPYHIAIVGAGLSGLSLSLALHRRGIQSIVYESDASPNARQQGGTLDMHHDSGLLALQLTGLMADFERLARPEDDCFSILNKHGEVLFDDTGDKSQPSSERPEIDRGQLRGILLAPLEKAGNIHWGKKVAHITASNVNDSIHTIHFTDGTNTTADLVVGADGAWSKVRNLLTKTSPEYTGITMVEGSAPLGQGPELMRRPGSNFALDDSCGIIYQKATTEARVLSAIRVPPEWADSFTVHFDNDPDSAFEQLLKHFSGWSSELHAILKASSKDLWARPLYAFSPGFTWEHRQGVTIIGDAAHLMSPYAGKGANLAMIDGAELGSVIADAVEAGKSVNEAVREFEKSMQTRAEVFAKESAYNLEAFMSDGGAKRAAEIMRMLNESGPPLSS